MNKNTVIPTTDDLNIVRMTPLRTPLELKNKYPLSEQLRRTVVENREKVNSIITKQDSRLLVITGPCSIHDEKAAFEYAERLRDLSERVKDRLLLVMRVYFEKPRTTIGWKGLINDPLLNGQSDINLGLERARAILLKVAEMGLPAASEFLDPIVPQYISDLISWVAIGARTTESQTHRELASGVSAAVGFKNGTSGSLDVALNAMESSANPHSFLGIDQTGMTRIVQTTGNRLGHLVLRGGDHGPNYDAKSVKEAEETLAKHNMRDSIIIDCSHNNSNKDHNLQIKVMTDILEQKRNGNKSIVGAMLESNLFEGNQKLVDVNSLKYGVSITDKCLNWDDTERILLKAHEELS